MKKKIKKLSIIISILLLVSISLRLFLHFGIIVGTIYMISSLVLICVAFILAIYTMILDIKYKKINDTKNS